MSQYKKDPRSYAMELVESGAVSAEHLLLCAISYLSPDECRDMLDDNELSPRFNEDGDDDDHVHYPMIHGGYIS